MPFLALIILTGTVSSALTIEKFDGTLDINHVSPNSQIAQIVKVTDAEGDAVNRSVLLNDTGNEFQFREAGNWTDMRYLRGGYYYAFFQTGSSAGDLSYRIIDQSPGGDTTETVEDLSTGQLDVNIETNYTGRYEAGSIIHVEATVDNEGEYYAVDVDGSGDVSENDILITDGGGSGTFSKSSDTVLAGSSPVNGWSLDNNNPWNSGTHTVAMMDSNNGDGWDPGSDIIIRDYNSGGTVSTSEDGAVNTGQNGAVDTSAGRSLSSIDMASGNKYYVSSDEGLDSGEEVVFDNDSDMRFTKNADMVVAGSDQTEGTPVTFTDRVPTRMRIASYDENGGGFDPSEDVVVFNRDNDTMFTGKSDQILLGATPPEGAMLNTGHVDPWADTDYTTPNASNLEVLDFNADGGAWNPTNDGIWIEGGNSNGYQPDSGDTLVAGNPETGMAPNQGDSLFDQWPNISGYDRNSADTGFNPSADAVIMDYYTGGTYSDKADMIIGGSIATSSSFSGGTEFTSATGFPSSWELDVVESIDGGKWEGSQDTIIRDRYDGGTYSPSPDEIINHGGAVDSPRGVQLRALSSAPGDSLMWSDLDSSNSYSSGDEIFRDFDNDTQYTSRADEQLAGLSIDIAGAGTQVTTTNLWQRTPYDSTPILFYDYSSIYDPAGVWGPQDAIVHDTDRDGVFTGQQDRIIEGNPSAGENGESLISTQPPNTSSPDVYARTTTGVNTTAAIQLGRTQEGVYTGDLRIPEAYDSRIILQVTAETPVSQLKGMESREIQTRAKGIGFDTGETELTLDVQKRGNYSRSVLVENLLDDQNSINISISQGLQNVTGSFDSAVSLPPGGNTTANFTFRVDEIKDYEGQIVFTEEETGISQNVDVTINAVDCQAENQDLCVSNTNLLRAETGQRENISMTLNLLNTGYRGSERTVTVGVEGNISSYVDYMNSTTFQDSTELEVVFQAMRPGNYSGTLTLSTEGGVVEVPLELSANFEQLEAGFSVTPQQIEIGTVPKGKDKSIQDIRVNNTGTVRLENISFNSSSFTLEQSTSEGIGEGQTRNYTLTFKSLESVDGQVQVTAYSQEETVSRILQVSGSTVKPVTAMKSDISSKVSSLRRKASSSSVMTQLTNIETRLSSIQTSWDKGNYQEAQNKYQSAMSDLSSLEVQIQSNSQDTGQTGSGGSQTGSQNTQQSSGGGGAILIVLILLILVLGAGFVLYTSYYPEEGDPLYDVLGDRE